MARHSESGLARRACHARRARRALERLANLFSILLIFQFVSHGASRCGRLKGFWKVCRAPRSFATSKAFFSLLAPEIAITLAWRNSRVSSRSMSSPFISGMTMSVMTKSVGDGTD